MTAKTNTPSWSQFSPQPAFDDLAIALDAESYHWLTDNRPDLAAGIDAAVVRGVEPIAVRRFVMRQTSRLELALRCEQYARFVRRSIET